MRRLAAEGRFESREHVETVDQERLIGDIGLGSLMRFAPFEGRVGALHRGDGPRDVLVVPWIGGAFLSVSRHMLAG